MIQKNYLKTLLKQHGVTIETLCSTLNIDRQKFNRWSEDDHPNNRVLRAAVKFALRYIIDTKNEAAKRIQATEEAEAEFRNRMDALGL